MELLSPSQWQAYSALSQTISFHEHARIPYIHVPSYHSLVSIANIRDSHKQSTKMYKFIAEQNNQILIYDVKSYISL